MAARSTPSLGTVISLFAMAICAAGCSSAYNRVSPPTDNVGLQRVTNPLSANYVDDHRRTETEGYIFVTNDTENLTGSPAEILYWDANANGNVAPKGIITGSKTKLVFSIQGIGVNSSGEILVVEEYPREILGFPAGSHGNVRPNVVISGSKTTLLGPTALALDKKGNVYVSDCAIAYSQPTMCVAPFSIKEFAARSNGNVAPIRILQGSKTKLGISFGLAIAPSGDIYASNISDNEILEFSATAKGNVAPSRVIQGTKTQLNAPAGVTASSAGIYTVNCPQDGDVNSLKFKLGATGNVAPISKLGGTKTKMQTCLEGLTTASDSSIFIADRVSFVSGNPPCEILHFGPDEKGNATPLNVISGTKTHIFIPLFVAASTKL